MDKAAETFTSECSESITFQPKNILIQNFNIPQDMVLYISKNASQFVKAKLFNSCKYFARNQKFVVIKNLSSNHSYFTQYLVKLDKNSPKIWVSGRIMLLWNSTIYSAIFPKLYYVDVQKLHLACQKIPWNEFCFLVSSKKLRIFFFSHVEIKYKNGTLAELGDVLEKLPLIQEFTYYNHKALFCTVKTAEKMAQLPIFMNLKTFDIGSSLPASFSDSQGYETFKQKHPFAKFSNNNKY